MANHLGMAEQQTIFALADHGWSQRRIARELGVHRETVSRYLKLARNQAGPAMSQDMNAGSVPGAAESASAKPAISIAGSGEDSRRTATTASPGRRSKCEPFRAVIESYLERGLSAQRIWQDLRAEHGFTDSYPSVQRFVRHVHSARPLPYRRMECAAGEEAQVDFGTGAPVIPSEGRRKRTHVFRIVLSHSRKGYSEAVYHQTTEEFLRCLENAFRAFGGVPQTLVIDNLKAAVTQPDWYDPQLHPKIQSFCRYYGVALLPTKPYTPRHKGKIERGIGYVKGNGLKGRTFPSLEAENQSLRDWEVSVADTRIHGTTRKQVGRVFEEVERPALKPLPVGRFPAFQEAQRVVHRDAHVEVSRTYYSVPPEYVGRSVWVRWDSHTVRVFSTQMTQIAFHARQERGHFSTQSKHIVSEKISRVERGVTWLLGQARQIGPHASHWGEAMLQERGIEGVRVLNGLLSLAHRHPSPSIEKACEVAQTHGAYRLRTIRMLIQRQAPKQDPFEFIEEHPIIRSLAEYGALVHAAIQKDPHEESKRDEIWNWKDEKEQEKACTKRYKRH